jgi:hypothetical protein
MLEVKENWGMLYCHPGTVLSTTREQGAFYSLHFKDKGTEKLDSSHN